MRYTIEENKLKLNVAGFQKEEIEVEQTDGYLVIKSAKELKTDSFKNHFYLSFKLQSNEEVTATLKDGILEITLPEKTKKKIPLN